MKTSTTFAIALVALAFTAACSSSEGGGDTGGGDTVGGGINNCGDPPLDCINGDYVTGEDGCETCAYWQCGFEVCGPAAEFEQCVGFGVTICDPGDGDCGALDSHGNGMTCPNGFACEGGEWGCACPTQHLATGVDCGELGQRCDVPSDLDCGPAFITIECTEDGWVDADVDGGEGGGDGCG